MSFVVKIDADAGTARQEIAGVAAGLDKAAVSSERLRDANGRWIKQGADGAAQVAAGAEKMAAATDKAAASSERLRDANGKWVKAGTEGATAVAAGTKKVADGHKDAAAAAEGHGDAIGNLIHLAEAYFAIHQFEALIDGYVETRNKINAVSESQANLTGQMEETFRIAQETRSNWDDLASAYQRISNSARGLGLSQRAVLDITEELAMGMKLSGASTQEASMSMAELTHAFATGTLTGREYKVMAKDAPAFMHELQVASGKTGSEFAEMGKHSKISAQLLIEWAGKASNAVKEKFGQTIPTISEGFLLIKNSAEKFFGSAALGGGVVQKLGEILRFVADNFDTIGKAVLAAGETLVTLFVIEKITLMVKEFALVLIGIPKAIALATVTNAATFALTAFFVAIVAGIALLRQFGDQINTNQKIWSNVDDTFVTVGDSLNALWGQFKALGSEIMVFVSEAWSALTGAIGGGFDTKNVGDSLSGILRLVSGFVGAVRGLFHVMGEDSSKVWDLMAYSLVEVMTNALNALMKLFGTMFSTLRHEVFQLLNSNDHDLQMQSVKAAVNAQAAEDVKSGYNARILQNVKETVPGGYDSADPSYNAKAIEAEYQKRLANNRKATRVNEYAQRGLDENGNDLREGHTTIGHITNPLEGTETAKVAKGAMSEIEDFAKKSMDDFDKAARDIAAQRVMDAKNHAGTVSTTAGKADEKAVDEKALKALEKLRNELRAIEEASNPVTAAQEKLAHAQDIVTQATKAYDPVHHKMLLTQQEALKVMDDYRRKEADALDPIGAWTRKQNEATAALRDNSEEQSRAAELTKFTEEMRKQGLVLTDQQISKARELILVAQQRADQMHAEQQFTAAILEPQHTYQVQLAALGDLLERGRITSEQYAKAMDGARATYLAGTQEGKTFVGGLEAAWLKAKVAAQSFGETIATTLVGDVDKLNEAIVTAANGGTVAWGAMVDSMIQDLERLLIKQLEVMAITALLNALLPGSGSVATASGATGAAVDQGPSLGGLFPNVFGSGSLAGSGQALGPGAYPAAASAVTPQAAAAPPGTQSFKIVNILDPSLVHAAMKTSEGEQIIMNTISKNRPAIRG